jgi:hypothetical protein
VNIKPFLPRTLHLFAVVDGDAFVAVANGVVAARFVISFIYQQLEIGSC